MTPRAKGKLDADYFINLGRFLVIAAVLLFSAAFVMRWLFGFSNCLVCP